MASTSENAPFIRFQLEPPPALPKLVKLLNSQFSYSFNTCTTKHLIDSRSFFCFQGKTTIAKRENIKLEI